MSVSVGIIIPVFNVAPYLPACLDSVLAQSLKDIEIICIDDCSSDESPGILAEYAGRDRRIRILTHERNMGLAAARNTGLDQTSADYVFFLDSDDILFSGDVLEHLAAIAAGDHADEVVGATLRWYEQSGVRLYEHHLEYLQENLSGVRFADHPYLRHNAIACNKLCRRAFLEEYNLRFNTRLKKFEDNVFSWKVHLLADSISLNTRPSYLHRIRGEEALKSIMQDTTNDVRYHVLAAQDMLDFLDAHPEFNAMRCYFDRYFCSWCYTDVRQYAGRNPSEGEKHELLDMYASVLDRLPAPSLDGDFMPERYRLGVSLLKQGHTAEAWQVFSVENFQAYKLQKQIDGITHSTSWKITAPLRKLNAYVKRLGRS